MLCVVCVVTAVVVLCVVCVVAAVVPWVVETVVCTDVVVVEVTVVVLDEADVVWIELEAAAVVVLCDDTVVVAFVVVFVVLVTGLEAAVVERLTVVAWLGLAVAFVEGLISVVTVVRFASATV